MSYGVQPYFTIDILMEKFTLGPNYHTRINAVLPQLSQFRAQVNEISTRHNAITAEDAVAELMVGNFSRTDAHSGAVYWYIFEKMQHMVDNIYPLPNSDFSPISTMTIAKLFTIYDANSKISEAKVNCPFPVPDDSPLVAFIPHAHVLKLKKDFSILELPESCHQQFEGWLDFALRMEPGSGALLLFFY